MKVEVFVYGRNYKSYFDPCFYKKFRISGVMETDYGLVKIYELNGVYLAIHFRDGVVHDGLTVIKQKKRDGFYPIGYIDEVGNFELVETNKEKLLKKLANLKRYEKEVVKDIEYPPVKKDNIDPLETEDYWKIRELFYNKAGTEPRKILTLVLRNGKYWKNGIIEVFMLQRKDRDNKDFVVAYDTKIPEEEQDEVLEIYGKAGETYILKPYAIRHLCDEKEAIRFITSISEDYEQVNVLEVLDEEGYEILDKIEILRYNNT